MWGHVTRSLRRKLVRSVWTEEEVRFFTNLHGEHNQTFFWTHLGGRDFMRITCVNRSCAKKIAYVLGNGLDPSALRGHRSNNAVNRMKQSNSVGAIIEELVRTLANSDRK